MKLFEYNDFLVTYIRQGNDKNGNPIFLVNIFQKRTNYDGYYWDNINNLIKNETMDKNDNIKVKSNAILSDIRTIIDIYMN